MTLEIVSTSSSDTERLGERLGRQLRGGEVIELASDLGGGKTTFVRGLARGMGSKDHVSSPTFKISNVYKAGNLELHHFDFYRLSEAGIIADELAEVISDPEKVIVIEWGQVVKHVLPPGLFSLRFTITAEVNRLITITFQPQLTYLVKDLAEE